MGAGFLGFGEAKNMKAVNNAMGELNADMGLRVLIGVGLINGKACFEPGSSIRAFSDLKSSKMPDGKMSYWPQVYTTVTSKKTLFYDTPVVDETKFEAFKGKVWQVNESQYANALNKVFPSFADMGLIRLDH
jgi:leucyl aminopeptidase (aminopeptidase T)